jgi:hypothetical protein
MLEAIAARLGRDSVRRKFAAEDLELLARHGLAARSPDGAWRTCCPGLSASTERLVDLVLAPRPPKEGTT